MPRTIGMAPARWRFQIRAALSGVAACVMLLTACTPSGTAPTADEPVPGGSRSPKILTIGIQRAPDDMHPDLGPRDPGVGGSGLVPNIPHDSLVIADDTDNYIARLAAEQISTETGTWVLNPGGTMVTTWKLRANVKWHDGTPFTSDDLLFSFRVYKDPLMPYNGGSVFALMADASAPDPLTFVVNWSAPYVFANRAPSLVPMPRHILEEPYRAANTNLLNHPWFTTEFVGLGPYRLLKWDFGVEVDYGRFEDYYLGRPPLDQIVVRLIGDVNTLIANILSSALDAITANSALDVDSALTVKERWEGTGNQVLMVRGGTSALELQHRPEYARPVNGLTLLPVRQGLYHAIDRVGLNELYNHGYGWAADSWVQPWNPIRAAVESAIPQFPYDVRRAQQLLAQAGWVRGPDGILVHQQTSDRFAIQLVGSAGSAVKLVTVLAEHWKAVGADVELYVIPTSLASDREHRSKLPGANNGINSFDSYSTDRLHSKNITSPANNWSLSNRGGYSNPKVDAILDKLVVTIDPRERIELHRDLLREQMGDVAIMSLSWDVGPVYALRGVKNIDTGTWNLMNWDKD